MLEGYRRYAIYWTPAPDSALARLGASWLGWDPASGTGAPRDDPRVQNPWRYGLHATLKAPFRLSAGIGVDGLDAAVSAFARAHALVRAPGLQIDDGLGFFALRPAGGCPAIDKLAADVVTAFDRFRAPLDDVERARRHPEALLPRHRALFERWGYPYVMEAYRFHITLTGPVPAAVQASTRAELKGLFDAALDESFVVDALSLLGDPGPDGAGRQRGFRLLSRHALAGSV
ncbi:MAG: DUF1045 domain-containing protein [Pseudomonadota bacterium]